MFDPRCEHELRVKANEAWCKSCGVTVDLSRKFAVASLFRPITVFNLATYLYGSLPNRDLGSELIDAAVEMIIPTLETSDVVALTLILENKGAENFSGIFLTGLDKAGLLKRVDEKWELTSFGVQVAGKLLAIKSI